MQEVYDFLKDAGYYFLATAEGDQPRVRPFGTYIIYEDKLYIQTGKIKDVSKQMLQNPKIEICAFKDGNWLRVTAEAVSDERLEVKEYVLEQNPRLVEIGYKADDGNMHTLYLKNATATFQSHAGVSKVIEF